MSRDMRDSPGHVEAPGGRPQGRLSAVCPSPPPRPSSGSAGGTSTASSRRYREGGLDDLEPRSRRPRTSPRSDAGRRARADRRAAHRELAARGLDAGPATIAWHLGREGLPVPSTSTIRRVLHAAGLVVPEPRKRPRSSWIRFEAAAPNEVWQSDFTHWRLADGTEVEIIELARRPLPVPARAARCSAGWRATTWSPRSRRGRGARLAGRDADRQRRGLHIALHRRPQQLRVPARLPRHPPEERRRRAIPRPRARSSASTRPSSAGWDTSRRRAPFAELQAQLDCLPPRLQRAPAAPGDGACHPGRGLCRATQGPPCGPRRTRSLPPPLRHDRQEGRHDPPACRAPPPPQGRPGPRPHAGCSPSSASRRSRSSPSTPARSSRPTASSPTRGYWRNTRRDPGRWPGSQQTG